MCCHLMNEITSLGDDVAISDSSHHGRMMNTSKAVNNEQIIYFGENSCSTGCTEESQAHLQNSLCYTIMVGMVLLNLIWVRSSESTSKSFVLGTSSHVVLS